MLEEVTNTVNHPAHYKSASGLESIDVIEGFGLGFRLGNVVKYILRAEKKGAPIEDLKKARWYLDREITKREEAAQCSPRRCEHCALGTAPCQVCHAAGG